MEVIFVNQVGKSTFDYALMSEEAVPNFLNFIAGFEIMSSHMPLTVIIEIQTQENTLAEECINEIESRRKSRVLGKHIWREDKKDDFMGRLGGNSSELCILGTKIIIYYNAMGKGEKILDIVVKRVGANMKQYKRKGQIENIGSMISVENNKIREVLQAFRKRNDNNSRMKYGRE
jgi:hypothetical protein